MHHLGRGGRRRRVGEGLRMSSHPVGHRLMADPQQATNAAEVRPLDVQLQGVVPHGRIVAVMRGLRRILAMTVITEIPLTA